MIRSMTGFARLERQGAWGALACELRSVNHRYLELSLRLPDELKPLEGEVRQQIAAVLRRGKVDASLYMRSAGATPVATEIDVQALDQLLERMASVRERLDGAAGVSPLDVLRWPGVLREAERSTDEITAAARELLKDAL
ncbi:MAG TPA: YicC/YloC family endoribonuclease, partial [Steroidobacteraceae bacterium]|nr:YicC/YloC family endoribonuclease [Steroidobacteraceae bacterium]